MKNVFLVRWKLFWKSLTRYLWMATFLPLGGILIIRYISSGFDHASIFDRISPLALVSVFAGLAVFIPLFALVMSMFIRKASVVLREDNVQGINYWGRRKHIPFHDIAAFSIFRSNGVNAIVVKSQSHGKIYISDHTERLEELLAELAASLPEPLQQKLTALPWHRLMGGTPAPALVRGK